MVGPNTLRKRRIRGAEAFEKLLEEGVVLATFFEENRSGLKKWGIMGVNIEPWGYAGLIKVLHGNRSRDTCYHCKAKLELISPFLGSETKEKPEAIYKCPNKECTEEIGATLLYKLPLSDRDLERSIKSGRKKVFTS